MFGTGGVAAGRHQAGHAARGGRLGGLDPGLCPVGCLPVPRLARTAGTHSPVAPGLPPGGCTTVRGRDRVAARGVCDGPAYGGNAGRLITRSAAAVQRIRRPGPIADDATKKKAEFAPPTDSSGIGCVVRPTICNDGSDSRPAVHGSISPCRVIVKRRRPPWFRCSNNMIPCQVPRRSRPSPTGMESAQPTSELFT